MVGQNARKDKERARLRSLKWEGGTATGVGGDHTGRIARHHRVGWHIVHHHGAGGHSHVVADGDATDNLRAAAYCAVVANHRPGALRISYRHLLTDHGITAYPLRI